MDLDILVLLPVTKNFEKFWPFAAGCMKISLSVLELWHFEKKCAKKKVFSSCKKGGFLSIRHNTIRDTTASLLEKVAYGVETEPHLMPVGNRKLPPGSNINDGARLDVAARGFWTPLDKAMFDIRVLL